MIAVSSPDDVFINCPFDAGYRPLFRAIVFAVFACGLRPRSALELEDGGFARLDKIMGIIAECRYGIHDLSRVELDPDSGLPRFNMPFELGLFLAAKKFGGEDHARKRAMVLDCEPYRYQRFISDLNGMDISAHAGDPARLTGLVRNWLVNVSRRRLVSARILLSAFAKFEAALPDLSHRAGTAVADVPYVDFEFMVTDWLLSARLED